MYPDPAEIRDEELRQQAEAAIPIEQETYQQLSTPICGDCKHYRYPGKTWWGYCPTGQCRLRAGADLPSCFHPGDSRAANCPFYTDVNF